METELKILGAAYGPKDVTGQVRKMKKEQKLHFHITNEKLGGDPWSGNTKTLVVVYKCGGDIKTAIYEEGECCNLSVSQQKEITSRVDTGDHLSKAQQDSSDKTAGTSHSLVILGAAYGKKNVTNLATKKVKKDELHPEGKFSVAAINDNWGGDSWNGHNKTLVVVYQYDGLPMLEVAKERSVMNFIASPPLSILCAAYGKLDVTNKVRSLVKNRELAFTPSNESLGEDGWEKNKKSFTVVYQYGKQTPKTRIVREDDGIVVRYEKADDDSLPTNPETLTILGASFGIHNVTKQVRDCVKDNKLQLTITKTLFFGHDPWKGVTKSLVVVFANGSNPPRMNIAVEGEEMTIGKPAFRYTDLTGTKTLLENGNMIALSTVNGKYITYDSENKLVAKEKFPNDSCALTILNTNQHRSTFIMLCKNKRYVTVDGSELKANGSKPEDATVFSATISSKGGLQLAIKAGTYVCFHSDDGDGSIRADCSDQRCACATFGVAFKKNKVNDSEVEVKDQNKVDDSEVELKDVLNVSDCEKAWYIFVWQLTGGFLEAIGLSPFIVIGSPRPAFYELIKSKRGVVRLIQDLVEKIQNGLSTTGSLISVLLTTIHALYEEGILWTVFKWMLIETGWVFITWALGIILECIFLPEVEAAELFAGFTVWGVRTTLAVLDLEHCKL